MTTPRPPVATVPAMEAATLEAIPADVPEPVRLPPRPGRASTTMPPLDELEDDPPSMRRAHEAPDTFSFDPDEREGAAPQAQRHPQARPANHGRAVGVIAASVGAGIVLGLMGLAWIVAEPIAPPVTATHAAKVAEAHALLERDPEAAIAVFRSVLDDAPKHAAAAYGLGLAYASEGHLRSAEDWWCRASEARGAIGSSARAALDEHGMRCVVH